MKINRDARSILFELKERTQAVNKQRELIEIEKKINERNINLNLVRKSAKKLFDELVTEENLFAVADKGESQYPLLFVNRRRPVEDEKIGYRNSVGDLGGFLVEELVAHNFAPSIIRIKESEVPKFARKIINRPGYYLGIAW